MEIRAIAVFSLAFLTLVPFTLGEVDRYRMAIKENGARFSEEIDVNERENVEVFRVPAHNNVDGADFYHDFKMRLTITRVPSRKVCYIAKMEPFMSPPEKLKADLARAASRSGPLPVQVDSRLVMETGPANRRRLAKEILDFCGALPIFNTEVYTDVLSQENGTAIIRRKRQKRQSQLFLREYLSCFASEKPPKSPFTLVKNCPHEPYWNLKCKMERHACYYYVVCDNDKQQVGTYNLLGWTCKTRHATQSNPSCCDYVCPKKNSG